MKKTAILLSVAFFALFSCNKELVGPAAPENGDPANEETVDPSGKYLTFEAEIPEVADTPDAPDTKTVTDFAAGKTAWEEGDEITITVDGNTYTYVAQADGARVGFLPKTDDDKIPVTDKTVTISAVYAGDASVISATQNGNPSEAKLPLSSAESTYSTSEAICLSFTPGASYMILNFAAEDITVQSLELISRGPNVAGTSKTITITPTSALSLGSGTASVTVLVNDFAKTTAGFFLKAVCSDNTEIVRTILVGKAVTGAHSKINVNLGTFRKGGISTAAQLCELATLVNNGYPTTRYQDPTDNNEINLLNDINFTQDESDKWVSIGNAENETTKVGDQTVITAYHEFSDVFDGNDHTIDYLNPNYSEMKKMYEGSLFGVISGNAVIKNLTIGKNSSFTYNRIDGMNRLGAVVCFVRANTCKLTNITNYASVTNNQKVSYAWIGGIAGQCRGTMTNLVNHGKVTAQGTYGAANSAVGGVVGIDDSSSNTHKNLKNFGEVEVINPTYMITAAGVIGTVGTSAKSYNCKLENCQNYGAITVSSPSGPSYYAAGVLGYDYCSTKTHTKLVNEGNITVTAPSSSEYAFVGGVVGRLHKSALDNSTNTNKGTVLVKNNTGTSEKCLIGGVAGVIGLMASANTTQPTTQPKCTNLYNYGDVRYLVEKNNKAIIGGIAGRIDFVEVDGWYNYGKMTLQQNSRLGGLIGTCYYQNNETVVNIKNCGFYGIIDAEAAYNDVNLLIGTFTLGNLSASNIKVNCQWKCESNVGYNVINDDNSFSTQVQATYNLANTASCIRLSNTNDETRYNNLLAATSYGPVPTPSSQE